MTSRNHTNHRIGESHQRAKASDKIVRHDRELHQSGMGYKRIGKTLGINWRTVADWCRYDTRWAA